MAAVTDSRQANVQPNHLPSAINLTIEWDGGAGTMAIPQGDKLSAKGNISFTGGVRKGLRFAGDPATVLRSLVLGVEGVTMSQSAADVHLSSPRLDKAGKAIANTGNNLTVCHTGIFPVLSTTGDSIAYQAQVYVTYLGEVKGYALSVRSFIRPTTVSGPVLVGEFSGLTVSV
jgi:hypothetical protein